MSQPEAVKGIEREAVSAWLAEHVPGATPPFEFSLITGGHSNLTYAVTARAGQRFVLRRPPLGAVLATAHDMAREHKIIRGASRIPIPVPRALGLCEDVSVNGAPFYVMNFADGHVLESADQVRELFPSEGMRDRLADGVLDTLAALHLADPEAVGLGDLGRREAYLDRQLIRWRTQWEKSKTRELPEMEQAYELLLAAKPDQIYTGIVHGDYRLGNMLSLTDGSISAVLDWELCTLGDTLADVGYLLNHWPQPEDPDDAVGPTAAGGFPSRSELLRRYAERTGHVLENVDYYRSFQIWRLAAIVEGVAARYQKGVMGDANADIRGFQVVVERLARQSIALVRTLD